MKNEEQIRMLLHPEKYTDEQLDQMLDGMEIAVPEAEEALAQITQDRQPRQRGWMRMAAAIVSVLMLSGIVYAAYHHLVMAEERPQVAMTERMPDIKKIEDAYGVEMTPTENTPVVFNNVELQQIMLYVAEGYGVKVRFKNKAARTIRFYLQWEADDTLQEIVNKINHFEKVHLTLDEETITIQ